MANANTVTSPFDEHKYLKDVSNLTLPEYILQNTERAVVDGKGPMIIDAITGQSHEYSDFESNTRKIGSSLYKRGMRKGDTAVYMTFDMLNVHVFICGVWRANGIVRASYPDDEKETLLDRIEESKASWILCDSETSETCLWVASKVSWKVEVIVVGEAEGCTPLRDLFADDGLELPQLELKPDDTALIICTSGTTGKSKSAEHTHAGLVFSLESLKYLPLTAGKPNLVLSKGTHVIGVLFPLSCFSTGKTALVMPKITKEDVFKAIDKYKPGFVWGYPPFLLSLVNDPDALKYDLSSLEVACSGGVSVTPAIVDTLMQFPNLKAVIHGYGTTEVAPICSETDLENAEIAKIPGSPASTVGRASPGVTLKIRDTETGESLGPNQRGEICVKSKSLFRSYYKNPGVTEKSFVDGFFLTGDIGYYDDNGFVYVVDRIKEIFKYFNNHISPSELEEIIVSHPDVAEVCVIGVPDPNGGDHIPRAFVTLRNGNGIDFKIQTEKHIQEFANEKLPNYKHLRGGVFIVPDLPKGKTGKITRQLVANIPVPS